MSYGNIKKVKTSGASSSTAEADGLKYSGWSASHTMAEEDFERMKKYMHKIKGAAEDSGIDPFTIAGIISRESRAGDGLDDDGWGDHGNAFGLMQVDKRWHKPHPNSEAWDSLKHLCYASGILVGCIGEIRGKFPNWTKEQQLKGGLAAYNKGASRVHSYDQVDANTTGGDYSNDVVARAQWYEKKHSESWCGIF